MGPIGLFGGTFDPIHYGHLRTAFEMLEALQFAEVRFVPSGDPPHRDGVFATQAQRLAMVEAATANEPGFIVDTCELERDGPSYTFDTLQAKRVEFSARPIGLILGMDAFLGLASWHRWDQLLDLAHIVVAHRPGWQVPDTGPLGELLAGHRTQRATELHEAPHGRIHVHAVTQLEISSTAIRELVGAGRDPRYLMPDAVRDIIVEEGCYQDPAPRAGKDSEPERSTNQV
ncbi:MAG: nicotinate-nucleotide adenylyltransferase [Woeseiaceae bacterium]|nr:nicotinate-nucleotide adenylyltransferase [Woeseiaceae bacterium]